MHQKKVRIIIDTNVWISILITNNFKRFDELIFDNKVLLLYSDELLSELISVVNRPKFKKYFNKQDVKKLIGFMQDFAEIVEVQSEVNQCRDLKDNFILSLAKDSNAEYIITGDYDLLDLEKFENTKILTINQFLQIF